MVHQTSHRITVLKYTTSVRSYRNIQQGMNREWKFQINMLTMINLITQIFIRQHLRILQRNNIAELLFFVPKTWSLAVDYTDISINEVIKIDTRTLSELLGHEYAVWYEYGITYVSSDWCTTLKCAKLEISYLF